MYDVLQISGIEQLRLIVDDFGKQYQAAMFRGLAHRLLEAGCERDLLPGTRAAVLREAAAGRPGVEQAEAAWRAWTKAAEQGSGGDDRGGSAQDLSSSEAAAVAEAGGCCPCLGAGAVSLFAGGEASCCTLAGAPMKQRPDVIVFDTTTLVRQPCLLWHSGCGTVAVPLLE